MQRVKLEIKVINECLREHQREEEGEGIYAYAHLGRHETEVCVS